MAEFECRLKEYRQMKDLTQEQLVGGSVQESACR